MRALLLILSLSLTLGCMHTDEDETRTRTTPLCPENAAPQHIALEDGGAFLEGCFLPSGQPHGPQTHYDEEAQRRWERTYAHGALTHMRAWHDNQRLASQTRMGPGNVAQGLHQQWYDNGNIAQRGHHEQGFPVGPWSYWYSTSTLEREGTFAIGGARTGRWSFYQPDGSPAAILHFGPPREGCETLENPEALESLTPEQRTQWQLEYLCSPSELEIPSGL